MTPAETGEKDLEGEAGEVMAGDEVPEHDGSSSSPKSETSNWKGFAMMQALSWEFPPKG